MEYIMDYDDNIELIFSESIYNPICNQIETIKQGIQNLKYNLNAIKIQKWYQYWKPFQDFKKKYSNEFELLIHLYRSDRKLTYKQKLSYIHILKNTWDEFNKYIPENYYNCKKQVIEFIFDCKYENKDSIIALLKQNKEYYLSNLNDPDIERIITPARFICSNIADSFKRKQNTCVNELYHLLENENNYLFNLYCGQRCSENIPIKRPHTTYAGEQVTSTSYCHEVSDLPFEYPKNLVENLIHIFDNTYFPYLIYKFLQYDRSNKIFLYYYNSYCPSPWSKYI
jgi:hypothetical protein